MAEKPLFVYNIRGSNTIDAVGFNNRGEKIPKRIKSMIPINSVITDIYLIVKTKTDEQINLIARIGHLDFAARVFNALKVQPRIEQALNRDGSSDICFQFDNIHLPLPLDDYLINRFEESNDAAEAIK